MKIIQKITPFLWFNNQAEEATIFYLSIFENSRVLFSNRYDEAGAKASGQAIGSIMVIDFELMGQRFSALNGGPSFTFTPAISFVISCENQKEIDHYWERLAEGGRADQCGWLTDKFGISWQVVPRILGELLSDPDHAKAGKVMEAMLAMTKLDISKLKQAAGLA